MTKTIKSNFYFIILISLYLIDQLAHLDKNVFRKICFKMILVQDRGRLCKKRFSIILFDSFSSLKLDDKLFNQSVGPLGANFSIVVNFAIAFPTPKYTKKDIQQIFKIVLED